MKPEEFLKGGAMKVINANDFVGSGGFKIVDQNAHPEVKKDLLQKATDILTAIFPGEKVGQAIGTLAGYVASPNKEQYDLSAPSVGQVVGDVAQGALTVAAPNIGTGATAVGRIGANAALGAGLGASGAIAEGKGVGEIAKEGTIGGALGGGISAGVEGVSALAKNLPRWFTKLALPKLSQSSIKNTPEELVDYALKNTKGLTPKQMYNNSQDALRSYESQVQAVLSHPEYVAETGSKTVVGDVIDNFQNAQLKPDQVIKYAKQVAPTEKALVEKVANGTATLTEKNQLRKALDVATKKVFTDNPNVTFAKEVGAKFAELLRSDVKTAAPELAPIFSEYAKEVALKNALVAVLKKRRVAGPIAAGVAGFAHSGLKGAAEAVAIEEGWRSPTGRLMAAKGVNALSKKGAALNALIRGGKATAIRKATSD